MRDKLNEWFVLNERAHPWCLLGMAWLAIIRGIAYFAGVFDAGYKIPAALEFLISQQWQLGIAGGVWIFAGIAFAFSVLTGFRLRDAAATLVGVKLTWMALHLLALIFDPKFNTALSVSIHAVLVMVFLTLVQLEIAHAKTWRKGDVSEHVDG